MLASSPLKTHARDPDVERVVERKVLSRGKPSKLSALQQQVETTGSQDDGPNTNSLSPPPPPSSPPLLSL